jgi:hypothetical protein
LEELRNRRQGRRNDTAPVAPAPFAPGRLVIAGLYFYALLALRHLVWIRTILDPAPQAPAPPPGYETAYLGLAVLGTFGCAAAIAHLLEEVPSWIGFAGAAVALTASYPVVWAFAANAPGAGPVGLVLALMGLAVVTIENVRPAEPFSDGAAPSD